MQTPARIHLCVCAWRQTHGCSTFAYRRAMHTLMRSATTCPMPLCHPDMMSAAGKPGGDNAVCAGRCIKGTHAGLHVHACMHACIKCMHLCICASAREIPLLPWNCPHLSPRHARQISSTPLQMQQACYNRLPRPCTHDAAWCMQLI